MTATAGDHPKSAVPHEASIRTWDRVRVRRELGTGSDWPLSVATEDVDPAWLLWLSKSALCGNGGEWRGVPGQESAAPTKRAMPTDCTERRCARGGGGGRGARDSSSNHFAEFSVRKNLPHCGLRSGFDRRTAQNENSGQWLFLHIRIENCYFYDAIILNGVEGCEWNQLRKVLSNRTSL